MSDISVLANLTALNSLYLGGTGVNDIRPLENLKRLKRLDLQGTQVSADDVEEFRRNHPNCEVRF